MLRILLNKYVHRPLGIPKFLSIALLYSLFSWLICTTEITYSGPGCEDKMRWLVKPEPEAT